jgi:hypothetical protein
MQVTATQDCQKYEQVRIRPIEDRNMQSRVGGDQTTTLISTEAIQLKRKMPLNAVPMSTTTSLALHLKHSRNISYRTEI